MLDDPAGAAAERLAAAAERGAHMALAGGSTPRAAYRRAAELGADWSGATLWFGDERCVPPDDERSNYRMAREALIEPLTASGGAPDVRRIPGERGPHAGAADYDRELHSTLGERLPRLDLVLLGLGPDAHCASLFPGQPALDEREAAAVGVERAGMEPQVPRVTLTLPLINAAQEILFLVAGADKADAVARAFEDEPSAEAPASLVEPVDGSLTVLLDPAAAGRLRSAAPPRGQGYGP